MGILRAEGFIDLATAVAKVAATKGNTGDAALTAATLDGRLPAGIGLAALTRPEERLLAAGRDAPLAAEGPGYRLALTRTGRLVIGAGVPDDALPVGVADIAVDPAEVRALQDVEDAEFADVAGWLAGLPHERVVAMVERIRQSLLHMAPVLLYTGDRCYTNLGRGNLVGKSTRVDSPNCVLGRLLGVPVAEWDHRDATFVACLHALLVSGPPVRAEEFSGTQLRPDRLEAFLRQRIASYGAAGPDTAGLPAGERLHVLAEACAAGRAAAVAAGVRPYRLIQGLNLNKQEHLTTTPVTVADVPAQVLETFALLVESPVPGDFEDVARACAAAAPGLREAGEDGFTSRFEQVLHELVQAATGATGSDVGMSRGPRRPHELARLVAAGEAATAVGWTTNAFYCCVTPSTGFVDRFARAPEQLPQVLRAISARMRYNGWHYLPHTIGVHAGAGDRDWFYAPTMSDVTDWSDQHHTGHVANGVRYAIRVPFGIDLAGAHRPGLHDFRLMRTDGVPYTEADLRASVAIGELLRALYQASAAHPVELAVTDFDNPWYQARYDSAALIDTKEDVHV
ncbi:hypothetical protein [Saccharothrix longispora]|uniref:hypothetical protein n=1 Tax=Saccharothrix longispora TaxID=33920 RepID=UPI0028FD9B0D|nr:hypothetical protein [Saccharothrix longispora]MDU0291037.1 hypothetical protein [Saccharothrix longispora]